MSISGHGRRLTCPEPIDKVLRSGAICLLREKRFANSKKDTDKTQTPGETKTNVRTFKSPRAFLPGNPQRLGCPAPALPQ